MARKLKNIKAKAHPPHYMMHKYWGRKPHNVVCEYIKNYSNEGEVVLDPFMGSGVVVIEALKNSREAYGVDLNPLSIFITQNTVLNINLDNFDRAFENIYSKVHNNFKNLYQTRCPDCNSISIFLNSVYDHEEIIRIKGLCEDCGIFRKNADESDLKILKKAENLFKKHDKEGLLDYPKDKILQYVKRSKRTHIDQLFTSRALLILSNIREEILKEKDTIRIYNLHLESLRIKPNEENFGEKNSEKLLNRISASFKKQVYQTELFLEHEQNWNGKIN